MVAEAEFLQSGRSRKGEGNGAMVLYPGRELTSMRVLAEEASIGKLRCEKYARQRGCSTCQREYRIVDCLNNRYECDRKEGRVS